MVEFGPRHPFGAGFEGRPATPVSPDEKKIEWPCRPSFMNLAKRLSVLTCKHDSSASRGFRVCLLITLPSLIVLRLVVLLSTIRDRHHICWLVHAAFQLTCVASREQVWICWVEYRIVSGLAESRIITIRLFVAVKISKWREIQSDHNRGSLLHLWRLANRCRYRRSTSCHLSS